MMRFVTVATVLMLAMAVAAPAQETSSWSTGVTTPEKRQGGPKLLRNDGTRAQPKGTQPAPGDGALPGSVSTFRPGPASISTHDKTIRPSGDDAAYEAFDQGRYLTALELAQKAAEAGDPSAHTLVGRIHQEGLGVPPDPVLAAKWYRRGAELGDREAMFSFGVILADGLGVKKDRAGAAQMFEAAAQRGHAIANYNLALLFLHGDGKPENPFRALAHMRYAAENNIVVAQYDLGTLYATGTGLPDNRADALEAARWIGRAAAAGHAEAELEYATMLYRGMGLEADRPKALGYLKSAAEKGLPVAQNRLARVLANGLGAERDTLEAAIWHLVAKSRGISDPDLDAVVAKLPRADRRRAEQAAEQRRDLLAIR